MKLLDEVRIRATASSWWAGVDILVMAKDYAHHEWAVVKDVIIEEAEQGVVCSPTFQISRDDAQVLMDDLWASGLRPTEGTGSAGALRAVEIHLKDMRKIAFDLLEQYVK